MSDGVPPELEALTPRELEVLRLIARGQTNADIAGELVDQHGHREDAREPDLPEARSRERAQAVVLAYECGYVTPRSGEGGIRTHEAV